MSPLDYTLKSQVGSVSEEDNSRATFTLALSTVRLTGGHQSKEPGDQLVGQCPKFAVSIDSFIVLQPSCMLFEDTRSNSVSGSYDYKLTHGSTVVLFYVPCTSLGEITAGQLAQRSTGKWRGHCRTPKRCNLPARLHRRRVSGE